MNQRMRALRWYLYQSLLHREFGWLKYWFSLFGGRVQVVVKVRRLRDGEQ